jgi:DNA topoisomerase-1
VWICANAKGHLQAVGRDARNRKQYRYHAKWREHQELEKYERLVEFAAALPDIRRAIARDLGRTTLDHERVAATVVHLLETTLIRVGNEEYARTNASYGLTTLRDRQVRVDGSDLRFVFPGKSGKSHDITLSDRRVATIVRSCQDLPGQRLFQYEDADGVTRPVGSSDVNEYLRDASGSDFTAKEFRTWMGTLYTAAALAALEPPDNARVAKKVANTAINVVAKQLGNTPTVARNSYVHPDVIDQFADGSLARLWSRGPKRPTRWLIVEERKLTTVLRAARRRQRATAA